MSVYRHRNSPYWQFDFQRAGHRFSGSTGVPRSRPRREAEAVEQEERRAADELVGEIERSGRKPLTLGEACARWMREVGDGLAERDLGPAIAFLKAQIGERRPLHAIADADVLAAMAARKTHLRPAGRDQDGKHLFRPISARTVNRTVPLLLRRVMRRARDLWGVVILREPQWGRLLLRAPRRPTPEITIEQEEAIDAAERADYHAARRFATITGLRLCEALLTWPQVDFDAGLVRVIAKGKQPRVVPLSREAYAILWAERGRHPEAVFTFVAKRTRIEPRTGRAYVRGERYPITPAGITSNRKRHWPVKARFHDLRHTAARRMLRATGDLKTTQMLLGHSDVSTTANFYADVLVEDVRRAMETAAADLESRKKSRKTRQASAKSLD